LGWMDWDWTQRRELPPDSNKKPDSMNAHTSVPRLCSE
jgi:hypothetical protein